MKGLAEKRPVFHSEADFQFALAWHIRVECKQPVRLEWKPFPDGPPPTFPGTRQLTRHPVEQATVDKYRCLTKYLESLRVSRLEATIPELEGILCARLPRSAKQDRKWWANAWKEPQAKSWMASGWKTGRVKVVRKAVKAVEFRLRMSVDLWLPGLGAVIELKYPTRRLECDAPSSDLRPPCESFSLRDQAAQDLTRYDFVKDVERLESVVARRRDACRGAAVILTNDPLYWDPPVRANTVDRAFRLHEESPDSGRRCLTGRMEWAEHTGGAKKGRECPIVLSGSYGIAWEDYPIVKPDQRAEYGAFRYLAVEVSRESAGAPAGESPKNRPGSAPSA